MRFTLLLLIILVATFNVSSVFSQGVGIGSTSFTPVSDALLELRSTSSGFLMPRMTQEQREAIASPSDGLMVYQTDGISGYYFHNGVAWNPFGGDDLGNHTATTKIILDDNIIANASGGDGIRISDAGNVGIGAGVGPPTARLEVISAASNANAITVQSTAANGWSSVDFRDQSGSLSTTFGFANSGTAGIFTNRAYMNSYDHDFILTRNSSERSIFISGSSGNVGINTDTPGQRLSVNDGNIRLQRTGGTAGEMQFQGTGAGITSFKAGAQGATNITYTLPTAAPSSGQVLSSDASGNMSWVTPTSTPLDDKLVMTLTSNVTDLDVTGVGYIYVNTNGSDREIRGTVGAVDKQVIRIINRDTNKKVKLKSGTGSQQFDDDLDINKREGAIIMFDGSDWYVISRH